MAPPGLSQARHSNIIDQRGKINFWKKKSLFTSRGSELTKVLGISCGALSSERVFSPCKEQGRGVFFSYAIPTGNPHKPPIRSVAEGKGAAWGEKDMVWRSLWWHFEIYTQIGWELDLQGDGRLLFERWRTLLKRNYERGLVNQQVAMPVHSI